MSTALIFVDPQNDFCAGGTLAVPDGDAVIPVLNRLRVALGPDTPVFITQDWHPKDHCSYVDNNPGATLFTLQDMAEGGKQMMWPRHCEQGSAGAEFHPGLERQPTDIVIQKGTNPRVDSYSGFGAEDKGKDKTDLDALLRERGMKRVVVLGLAYDYCVAYTAKDAAALGYEVYVVKSGCRAVAADSAAKEETAMLAAGVKIVNRLVDLPEDMLHDPKAIQKKRAIEHAKACLSESQALLAAKEAAKEYLDKEGRPVSPSMLESISALADEVDNMKKALARHGVTA